MNGQKGKKEEVYSFLQVSTCLCTFLSFLVVLFFAFTPKASAQSPDFSWAHNSGDIGGIGGAADITCDGNGNIYMVGDYGTSSLDFGGITLTNCPGTDGLNFCLVKYDTSGNTIWARNACGDFSYILPTSVMADNSGNVFVTGYFHGDSVSFDNVTIRNPFSTGLYDNFFVVKYSSGGNVIWAKCAGDGGLAGSCSTNDLVADLEGNIYLIGDFSSHYLTIDNDTVFNSDTVNYFIDDFFLLKLDPSGNVVWLKSIGGSGGDYGKGISVSGSTLDITGNFGSPVISFQGIILTNTSLTYPSANFFVARFDTAGNVIWAVSNQSQGNSYGVGIVSNPDGRICITGNFGCNTLIIGNDTLINPVGGNDYNLFTTVFDALGHPVWAKAPEEDYEARVKGISADTENNFYIIGRYGSHEIRFDSVIMRNAYGGHEDIFIVKYNVDGDVIWAKSVGGEDNDFGEGITNFNGSVYIAGMFWSYQITFGGIPLTGHGTPDYTDDIYVGKLSGSCAPVTILQQPQNQFQVKGKTVTFSVIASGPPQIYYQWYRNGYPVSGANQSSYTTWPLTSGNNGDTYFCAVSNCSYSNTINTIFVTVEVCTGGTLQIFPYNPAFKPGDSVSLTGTVYGSSPHNFQWFRDGTEIPGATQKDYTTPILSLSDTGTIYYCRIINCRDLDTSQSNKAVLRLAGVGIEDPLKDAEDGLTIYPNPAKDRVFIVCAQEMIEIKIIDLMGQVVCMMSDPAVNYSFLPGKPGIYFIVVKTRTRTVVRKLVKVSL